jgi:multiple sugar transport system ATP-binding protein
MAKKPKDFIDKKVREVAEVLDITHLLDRKPKALSGGQRQRVAMGRAMVREPKVFLMDEPLSNLDAKLRVQMRAEISKTYHRLQTTFIYVTHDQTEAMTLGTKIVVLKDGVIQQVDTPQNLYNNPSNLFVAGFIGSPQMNFLNGKIEENGGKLTVKVNDDVIYLNERISNIVKEKGYINKEVTLGIRPENISDNPEYKEKHDCSIINAKVDITELLGAESLIHLIKDNIKITAKVNGATEVKPGDNIKILLNNNKIHIFDKETEATIV